MGVHNPADLDLVDRDNGQAGIITPGSRGWSMGTQALTANRGYLARFVPSRNMAVTKLAFVVTTNSGTDDPVDVGIYDDTMTKIVSSGATTGKLNTNGLKTVDITTTNLVAGRVYYAAISANSTATLLCALYISGNGLRYFGTTPPTLDADQFAASHPLPTGPLTPGGVGSSWVPILAVRDT